MQQKPVCWKPCWQQQLLTRAPQLWVREPAASRHCVWQRLPYVASWGSCKVSAGVLADVPICHKHSCPRHLASTPAKPFIWNTDASARRKHVCWSSSPHGKAQTVSACDLQLPVPMAAGAVQKVVDLLGPPPATVMAWEQQQLQQAQPQSPHGQHTTAPAGPDEPAARSPHYRTSSIRVGSGNAAVGGVSSNSSNSSQHVRVSEQRSRSGAVDGLEGDGASVKDPTEEQQQGMQRNRRK